MRLIDADVLFEVLKEKAINEALAGNMTAHVTINGIIDEIDELTTAYDIEKVVEELENDENQITFGGILFREPLIKVAADAIDILKKRGEVE